MFFLGLILLLGGGAAAGYGFMLNNDLEAVWTSFAATGNTNPGLVWIVGGIVAAVLGLVFMLRRRA